MKNIQNKLLALLIVLMTVPMMGWAHVSLTPTRTNVSGNSGETYDKAFDGRLNNKWCGTMSNDGVYVEFHTDNPIIIKDYYIYTGNDINNGGSGNRNPKAWVLYAKANESDLWTAVSTVTDGELPTICSFKKKFRIANEFQNNSYQYFKFEFSSIVQGNIFEIGEISIEEVECPHTFPSGSAICSKCGYVMPHDHEFVNSECTKCGFLRKLDRSNVGAVGLLDGREAIVVELNVNGVTKKVAVATMNVGATSVDEGAGTDAVAPCHGKMFTFADANNASKTGLSDGWYVPSKDELEALMNKCSWNGTKKGLEWISEDHGTSFFLPVCGFTNPNATTPIYRSVHADYWTSTESDSNNGWNLFFNADGKQVRAFDKTYKFNIRPFHEFSEISGVVNANVRWTLNQTLHVLTFEGTGSMVKDNTLSNTNYEDYKEQVTTIVISEGITEIPDETFRLWQNIQEVSLPGSLVSMGNNAFYLCSHLQKLIYGEGMTEILPSYATQLTTVVLPNSATSIADDAFRNCKQLQNINIPSNVETIGNDAFEG